MIDGYRARPKRKGRFPIVIVITGNSKLHTLKATLKTRHTPVEIYTYEAQHGFFTYTRQSNDKKAAETSWERTVKFFSELWGSDDNNCDPASA